MKQLRHNIKAKYAWLSPNGKLYECEWGHHTILAKQIIANKYKGYSKTLLDDYEYLHQPDDILTNLRWIKLTNPPHFMGYCWFPQIKDITQAQINTIDRWCNKHKASYPAWVFNNQSENGKA